MFKSWLLGGPEQQELIDEDACRAHKRRSASLPAPDPSCGGDCYNAHPTATLPPLVPAAPLAATVPRRSLHVQQAARQAADQSGVTSWLEGWKRIAEEQGCAAAAPAAVPTPVPADQSFMPHAPSTSALAHTQPMRSAPLPQQHRQARSRPLSERRSVHMGCLQAVAAPPPHAHQFSSPFSFGQEALGRPPTLPSQQRQQQQWEQPQQQQCFSADTSSEAVGADSPPHSHGSSTRRNSGDEAMPSLLSGSSLSCSTQVATGAGGGAARPSLRACYSIPGLPCMPEQQLASQLYPSEQAYHAQQQPGSQQYQPEPLPAPARSRRATIDGCRPQLSDSLLAWGGGGSLLPLVPSGTGSRQKRKSEDVLVDFYQPPQQQRAQQQQAAGSSTFWGAAGSHAGDVLPSSPCCLTGSALEEHRIVRRSVHIIRPAPAPTADASLSAFFSSGAAAAAAPALPPSGLASYPCTAPVQAQAQRSSDLGGFPDAHTLELAQAASMAADLLGDDCMHTESADDLFKGTTAELAVLDAELAAATAALGLPAAHSPTQ